MYSNRTTRAGLIGAGNIAEFHLAALRRLPRVEVVGVCDADPARAAAFASRFGIPPLADPAALRGAGADVLHVLTPPHTHAPLAIEALELGCDVIIEKPLAEDVADCDRIAEAARRNKLRVCVGHSLLFDPQVRKALAAVRRGDLGRVVSVDILRSSTYPTYTGGPLPPHYRTAGYPFRDLGVHALYLLEAFLGPIEDVHAAWSSLGGDPNLAFDEWRAQVRCRDGLGQVQLSWNVRPIQSQIIIQGTRGVLRIDLFLMTQCRRATLPMPKAIERVWHGLSDSVKSAADLTWNAIGFARGKLLPYHGVQQLVSAFYESRDDHSSVPVSIDDARRVVHWTEHVARAADLQHARQVARLTVSGQVPFLVTGASGALGEAVVSRLRTEGRRVRVMLRRAPDTLPDGVEVALGDLGDGDAVDRAVRGAAIVVHAGAAMRGPWAAHECGTVNGTRNVLEACRRHGVQKLVHVSSLSVVDWAGGANSTISESTPLEPRPEDRGSYTRAKLAAENLVKEFSRDGRVPAVIIRPGQIFGGRIPLLTPAVARQKGDRWLVLGDGHSTLPLVYMDDVVDGILAAAAGPVCDGSVIQLVDNVLLTQRQVLANALGPDARIQYLPRPFLIAASGAAVLLFRCLGRSSPVSPYRFRSALACRTFRSENAMPLLGWHPRVGVMEGMRRVLGRPLAATPVEQVDALVDGPEALEVST